MGFASRNPSCEVGAEQKARSKAAALRAGSFCLGKRNQNRGLHRPPARLRRTGPLCSSALAARRPNSLCSDKGASSAATACGARRPQSRKIKIKIKGQGQGNGNGNASRSPGKPSAPGARVAPMLDPGVHWNDIFCRLAGQRCALFPRWDANQKGGRLRGEERPRRGAEPPVEEPGGGECASGDALPRSEVRASEPCRSRG